MKLYLSIIVAAMLIIGGCGGNGNAPANGDKAATGSVASPSPTASDETKPEARVVSTVNGDVSIPAQPERIAATYYVGELAALGIKPAGASTRLLPDQSPNLSEFTSGSADIGQFPPNKEAIVALEPDLILATDFDEVDYVDYSKIAPTVIIPWSADDVWAKLRAVAALLDKEEEAEVYISDYEEKAIAAREAVKGHVAEGETVSIIRFFGSSIRVYGGRDVGHAFYEGLQLGMPAAIEAEVAKNPNFTSTEDISLENIPDYSADRIFVLVTDEEGDRAYKEAQKLAVWSNLPAVKNGKVYELPANIWFNYDPISVQVTLDEAVKLLTEGEKS
ncbi:ABC transporter substrate-binding protein [Paenibacillus sp. PAMC21692]|uniref:ABC transporter substrate-binding protein n=1 Tax=Paenibacillus sp. PAMC21692 TaxID=2762320 RepID=UPI00164D7A32|nr:ABC transporter substrate-binding protein [Paenibacillus sp. PAMC21692]QNK57687.1 ABC transporter substrate-binding protein [Paenibacillus sp. PAMC21692]